MSLSGSSLRLSGILEVVRKLCTRKTATAGRNVERDLRLLLSRVAQTLKSRFPTNQTCQKQTSILALLSARPPCGISETRSEASLLPSASKTQILPRGSTLLLLSTEHHCTREGRSEHSPYVQPYKPGADKICAAELEASWRRPSI